MGAKYQQAFEAADTYTYRLTLDFDGYASTVSGLTFADRGHTVAEWMGYGDPLAPGPMPADISVRIQDQGATILTDIKNAGEGAVTAIIDVDQGAGYVEYLRGTVNPGQCERSRNRFGGVSTIAAFCGLDELQGVTFEEAFGNSAGDATGITGTESLAAGLSRILAQTGHALPLRLAQEWYWYGSAATATDQNLEYTFYQRMKFVPDEEDGSTFLDEVLRNILADFGLRLFQASGYWWAVQVELLEASFAYYQYAANYYTAGLAPTRTVFDPSITLPAGDDVHLYREEGGTGRTRAALLSAAVVYDHGTVSDTLVSAASEGFEAPYTSGVAFGWASFGVVTASQTSRISEGLSAQFIASKVNSANSNPAVDPFDPDAAFTNDATGGIRLTGPSLAGGGGNLVGFSLDILSDSGSGSDSLERYVFIEFKVGANWLTSAGTWSASQSIIAVRPGSIASERISVVSTAEIPASGTLVINIWHPVEAHDGAKPTSAGVIFDNLKIDFYPAGSLDAETTTTEATITGSAATRRYRDGDPVRVLLGDGPTANTLGSLLTGSGIATSNWGRGVQASASGINLHQLMAESLVNLRDAERDYVEETYRADSSVPPIEIVNTPVIAGTRYAMERLVRTLDLGLSDIGAAEISLSSSGVTYAERQQSVASKAGGSTSGGSSAPSIAFSTTSVSALGSLGGVVGDIVHIRGWSAASARGAGYFQLRAADPYGLGADGGVVVASSDGKFWVRVFDGLVQTDFYGPTADGATDDTTKVQAAATMAKTLSRGLQVSGTLGVSRIKLANGIKSVTGPGTLKALSGAVEAVLTSNDIYNGTDGPVRATISGIEVDCNALCRSAMFFSGMFQCVITGNTIRNLPDLEGAEGIRLHISCADNKITGNTIILPDSPAVDSLMGIVVLSLTGDPLDINSAPRSNTDGYKFELTGATDAATISLGTPTTLTITSGKFRSSDVGSRCYVLGAGAAGAELFTTIAGFTNTNTVTLANAASTAVSNAFVYVQIASGGPLYTGATTVRNIVRGNIVQGGTHGIYLQRTEQNVVVDNTCIGQKYRNIIVGTGSEWNLFSNNMLLNCGSSGLQQSYGCRNNMFIGNTIRSFMVDLNTDAAAIESYVGCSDNFFIGNRIRGEWEYGIYLALGEQRSHVMNNDIAGTIHKAAIGIESDWRAGLPGGGATYSRESSNYHTAVAATAGLVVRGNSLANTTGAAIYVSQVQNMWGVPYENKNHVFDGNWFSDSMPHYFFIYEGNSGYVSNLVLRNYATDDLAAVTAAFSATRGYAHFTDLYKVADLINQFEAKYADNVNVSLGDDRDLRIYHNGADSVIDNNTGRLFLRNLAQSQKIFIEGKKSDGSLISMLILDPDGNNQFEKQTTFGASIKIPVGHGAGKVLTSDADGVASWGTAGAGALDDLDDVTETTPADNDVLAYDLASEEWINQTAGEAGLATATHSHANMVKTDTLSEVAAGTRWQDNQSVRLGTSDDMVLIHDGTNNLIQIITGLLTIRNTAVSKNILVEATDAGSVLRTLAGFDPDNGVALDHPTGGTAMSTVAGGVNLPSGKVLSVAGAQVVSARVVNAALANAANSGDATTDALIEALKSVITSHGLGASS